MPRELPKGCTYTADEKPMPVLGHPDAHPAPGGLSTRGLSEVERNADDGIAPGLRDSAQRYWTPTATARLFQCPAGAHLLQDIVKLPCGESICRACVPETYTRDGIARTWPGTPDRIEGIRCPCCGQEHAKGDCWPDYLSNTALSKVRSLVAHLGASATVEGRQELLEAFEALQLVEPVPDVELDISTLEYEDNKPIKATAIQKMEIFLRREMDCAICHSLLHRPWTTSCGHTFCMHCIARSFAISPYCPHCRTPLSSQQLDTRVSPPNDFIVRVTTYFWADELQRRKESATSESPYPCTADGLSVPLFICTVSFPRMPTMLHVFEPKYRNMMRRVWDNGNGGKHFGMVLPDRINGIGQVGVHLRIDDFTMLSDGRSLMETTGTSRFLVKRCGLHPDGYVVAEVEDLQDVSLYEEENREAAEISNAPPRPQDFQPTTYDDFKYLSTKELMDFARGAILDMRQFSPAWLNSRILAIYGQCPNDPSVFPWWLGSLIPMDEKYKMELLEKVTVRERMKMCCEWIVAWNAYRRSSW